MSEGIKSMEKTPITVREARPDDAEAVVTINYNAWMDAYPPIVDGLTEEGVKKRFNYDELNGLKKDIEKSRRRLENPENNSQMYVHISSDTQAIDGFIVTGESKDGGKSILALYVDPDTQGRGVGGALITEGLRHLHADTDRVTLGVISNNEKAISFYQRHGFTKLRDIPEAETRDSYTGIYMPETEMVREPAPL